MSLHTTLGRQGCEYLRRVVTAGGACLLGLTLAFAEGPGQGHPSTPRKAAEAAGKWKVSPSPQGSGNRVGDVYLVKDRRSGARDSCTGEIIKAYNAQLVIGCRRPRLGVFLHNLPSVVPYGQDEHDITLRFDAEPEVQVRTRINRPLGGDAVPFPEPEQMVTSIRSHKRLVVRLMPHCLKPQELVYDLRGLDAVLEELPRHGCPIDGPQR